MGSPRRRVTRESLLDGYRAWHGLEVPSALRDRYFPDVVQEFECPECRLRWCPDAPLGESDYYEFLSQLPWYYLPGGWDKKTTRRILAGSGFDTVLEVGCGDGAFLDSCRTLDIRLEGVEVNRKAIDAARGRGFTVHLPEELPDGRPVDALVMLQTLEHIRDPLSIVADYVRRTDAQHLIIAVPSHETLLGKLSDPLIFPPHHYSSWSVGALERLGQAIGFRVVRCAHDTLRFADYKRLMDLNERAASPPSNGGPNAGRLAAYLTGWLRCDRQTMRRHTVLAHLTRRPNADANR